MSARAARWVVGLVGLGVVAALGLVVRARTAQPGAGGAAASASAEGRAVPVVTAVASARDVPIYLDGLGNVTPVYTITVKTLVDGLLQKVLFKEGDFVKKGQVIAQVDPRPYLIQLHTAEAAEARDAATLRNAKLDLERYRNLRAQNLIPQQQLDTQQTLVDTTDAALKSDEVQAENARLQLDYAAIKSPIDGVTGVRLVDPGNIVHQADTTGIVIVTQLDPIAVLFTLPEDDLPRVNKQLAQGPIPVEVTSRDGATKLGSGEVALVDNEINPQTATMRLKAIVKNPDKALWPSEFVKARILLTTRKNAITVPATAIQRGPQETFVYVVGADKTASQRPVEVETIQGETAIISKGVAAGDEVVSEGQTQLRPGSKVAPRTQAPRSAAAGSAPP
jgi:membrane fusion protein, multidrug efflux system